MAAKKKRRCQDGSTQQEVHKESATSAHAVGACYLKRRTERCCTATRLWGTHAPATDPQHKTMPHQAQSCAREPAHPSEHCAASLTQRFVLKRALNEALPLAVGDHAGKAQQSQRAAGGGQLQRGGAGVRQRRGLEGGCADATSRFCGIHGLAEAAAVGCYVRHPDSGTPWGGAIFAPNGAL